MWHLTNLFIVALAGTFSTYSLSTRGKCTKIQASSLSTLLFASLLITVRHFSFLSIDPIQLAAAFYGATFIGMTSSKVANAGTILLSVVCYSVLLQASSTVFVGFGGKLGFIAAISVLLGIGLNQLIRATTKTQK